MRTGITALAAALAAALVFSPGASPGPGEGRALAASSIDWNNKRDAARAHAAEIKQAWAALAAWIERVPQPGPPSDPDLTNTRGPHIWLLGPQSDGIKVGETFAVVTAEVWLDGWTERGLSFRFCDQRLAVFAETDLRGTDMVTTAVEGGLQIVRGSTAEGIPQSGYPDAAIPACMGTLPEGHAVLLAAATDPFHWTATKRRIAYNDWEIQDTACAAGETGKIRYSQARPIELHPWAVHPSGTNGYPLGCTPGTDPDCRDISGKPMDMVPRWEAACADRWDGTFTYAGPVYGTVTVAYPAHGQCDPPDLPTASIGDDLPGAVMTSMCRAETETEKDPCPAQVIHFHDDLCSQAKAMSVSRDSSQWLGQADYVTRPGVPFPAPPPDSACKRVSGGATSLDGCQCPPNFSAAPWAGIGRKIEKIRWIWLENIPAGAACPVGREHLQENSHQDFGTLVGSTGGYGWGQNRRRFYPNPGGGWRADCVQNTERDYQNCYRIETHACDSAAAQAVTNRAGSIGYSVDQHTGYTARVNIGTNDAYTGDPSFGEGTVWEWGNLDAQTLTGTATLTGSVTHQVWSNTDGTGERFRQEIGNTCTYATGLLADDGCNWGHTSEDGTCI